MAHDAAGNANLASTSTDHTVTVTLDQPPSDIVFSGNTGLSSSDVTGPALFTAGAVDADDTTGFVYKFYNTGGSLTGTQTVGGDMFSINSSTGVVTSNDAATGHSYTLAVDVADSHGAHYHEAVTLVLGSSSGDSLSYSGWSNDLVMYGFGGYDTITGGSGNDYLVGGGIGTGNGTETLSGGAGNDWIVYEAGSNSNKTVVLNGGADNDTLVIRGSSVPTVDLSSTSDQTDTSSGNNDRATVTNFENVDASGATSAISITGSSIANILIGGEGVDTLTGGGGADHFQFNTTTGAGDHITDFTSGQDVIDLLNSAFGNLGVTNSIDSSQFVADATNTFAHGEAFHFDTANNTLYYNNAGAAVALAHLDAGHVIAATDIHIV
jgi:Ca2+-binding RTX toxin-like protein